MGSETEEELMWRRKKVGTGRKENLSKDRLRGETAQGLIEKINWARRDWEGKLSCKQGWIARRKLTRRDLEEKLSNADWKKKLNKDGLREETDHGQIERKSELGQNERKNWVRMD